ncbi:aldo/keto reductase [Citrobacter freundii]|uniref:aldo/keto reductase n=1 Tax=Enterobacter roggenkampii TaxID=1812935 RepID=UPI0028E045E5|nr:aldo/keto reductase [Enterobacter roggenkampii]ELK6342576.1 aldo/keto reductase [Citrobacter freundii]MDU7381839.1 aldo/keto reductase [Enterobacteriaceae bacterium]MEB6620541.1 aldo/keto reductase [Enterobacter roggenkampii]
MEYRKLRDLEVSAVGLGCMGFSHGYGAAPDPDDSVRLIRQAFELGCSHFDTAEGYGAGDNEVLTGQALKPVRSQVILATKFFIADSTNDDSAEKQIRRHLDASLERLGTDYVDLYYQHRVSDAIPVEEIAGVMGKLIQEGKIRGWGQSQPTEEQIRRAHSVTPLTAVQSEYSMMERMFERDVIPACRELNIGFVPFSPLASGFLSGTVQPRQKYEGDDVRRVITRFSDENIRANQPVIDLIRQFAADKKASPAQISLAWMLCREDFIAPIPGSRKPERIRENLGAADIHLDRDEISRLDEALNRISVHGNRTDEDISRLYR